MFAAVLDFLLFLFVTFFLVPALVVLAHVMRSWAVKDRRTREARFDERPRYDGHPHGEHEHSRMA